jgi:hypothetical protein
MTEQTPITAEQPADMIEAKQDAAIDVDVEALPDIESGTPHELGSIKAIPEGSGDSGAEGAQEVRQSKRVKLEEDNAQGTQDASNDNGKADDAAKQEEEEDTFDLRMTWAGQGFDFRVNASDRIYDFKVRPLPLFSCLSRMRY